LGHLVTRRYEKPKHYSISVFGFRKDAAEAVTPPAVKDAGNGASRHARSDHPKHLALLDKKFCIRVSERPRTTCFPLAAFDAHRDWLPQGFATGETVVHDGITKSRFA
jgi:hypothetical protein